MTTTDTVSFGTKGQVVIPSRLRKEFEIEPGTRAYVEATPEGILLRPVTLWAIKRGFGSARCKSVRRPVCGAFKECWINRSRTPASR